MRAPLVDDESYDVPPRLGSGVLVGIKGVVHVVRENRGIQIQLYCRDHNAVYVPFKSLEQGWFEAPTCVRCALHPGAIKARYYELLWRIEWWQREGNQLAAPRGIEPTL